MLSGTFDTIGKAKIMYLSLRQLSLLAITSISLKDECYER